MKKMKLLTLTILMCLFSNLAFGQTYSFSSLTKKAIVQTTSGKSERTIGTYQGPYNFVFENPKSGQLFTLLKPGQSNGPGLPWYGFLQNLGYVELNGKILKKSLFYNTGTKEDVTVLISDDFSIIIIYYGDGSISEYNR